jgi:hypothetical protein
MTLMEWSAVAHSPTIVTSLELTLNCTVKLLRYQNFFMLL